MRKLLHSLVPATSKLNLLEKKKLEASWARWPTRRASLVRSAWKTLRSSRASRMRIRARKTGITVVHRVGTHKKRYQRARVAVAND